MGLSGLDYLDVAPDMPMLRGRKWIAFLDNCWIKEDGVVKLPTKDFQKWGKKTWKSLKYAQ